MLDIDPRFLFTCRYSRIISAYYTSHIPHFTSHPFTFPLSLITTLTPSQHTTHLSTEALLALTVDGVAKHWLLPTRNDMKDLEQIFEEKSQCLDIKNPLSLAAAPHQQSGHCSVLIVCAQFWMVRKMKTHLRKHRKRCKKNVVYIMFRVYHMQKKMQIHILSCLTLSLCVCVCVCVCVVCF